MASGQVQVTFADLEEAAANTGVANRNIQVALDDLYRMLMPLYELWQGEAAISFQYQHQMWVRAADDMNQVLADISALLSHAHIGYTQTETAVTNVWLD